MLEKKHEANHTYRLDIYTQLLTYVSTTQIYSNGKDLANKNVFNCLLNAGNDDDEVVEAVTRNERSPMVQSRVHGTISRYNQNARMSDI